MSSGITVFNIREYLNETGDYTNDTKDKLKIEKLLREFSCPINLDVERFFTQQAVNFAKLNQSVTYLALTNDDAKLAGYFTLAIKSISVNAEHFSNTMRRKIERVSEVNEQTGEYILAAYLIAQLSKNYTDGRNKLISGAQLLQSALDTIRRLQYMAGGTVVFLEAGNVPQLLDFYTRCGFKQFAVRQSHSPDQHKLVQLLRVL